MSEKLNLDIENLQQRFINDFQLSICLGAELEFYVEGADTPSDFEVFNQIERIVDLREHVVEVQQERGRRQYELATRSYARAEDLIRNYRHVLDQLSVAAAKWGRTILPSAKPYPDRSACGLHIHLSLIDPTGKNVFQKPVALGRDESKQMLNAIGGLLVTLPESMVFFAPREDDYVRYRATDPDDALFTPTHFCWGGDNRSCALRIPTSTEFPESRHLEHRVPSPTANLINVVAAILAGAHFGLKNSVKPNSDKLYGRAFDSQFSLQRLPNSLVNAIQMARSSNILQDYFRPIESVDLG